MTSPDKKVRGSIVTCLAKGYMQYPVRGDSYRMSKAYLNMLSAVHRVEFTQWGCKVCAFNPGFCVTNLTGEAGQAYRVQAGAGDPKEPAAVLLDIVLGKRDADFEKSGILDVDGGIMAW